MVELYAKDQETNHSLENDKAEVLSDSKKGQKEVNSSIEYNIANGKFKKFMSNGDDSSEISDEELSLYYFDTVNWWINRKPYPKMVIDEVKSLSDTFEEIIDGYLKVNPAKIKELQVKLNDWINYWMVIDDKSSPSGRRTIHPIDIEVLKRILQWTGMELTDNWSNSKRRYTIKEDWMLWPQTFAALCCFKKEYRKTTTTHTNRGTWQN